VERGALARRGLAVPAPVLQLLVEKPSDQPIACLAEVRTTRTLPLIQGSTSPSKKGDSSNSGPQVLLSRTRPIALRARSLVESNPRSSRAAGYLWWKSSPESRGHHPIDHRLPQGRGAAHPSPRRQPAAAHRQRPRRTRSMRSRMTCQRIEGSESSSHCMTDFLGSGASRWRVLITSPLDSMIRLRCDRLGRPRQDGFLILEGLSLSMSASRSASISLTPQLWCRLDDS